MRGLVDHQALLTLEAAEYIIYFTALHVGLHFTDLAFVVLVGRTTSWAQCFLPQTFV